MSTRTSHPAMQFAKHDHGHIVVSVHGVITKNWGDAWQQVFEARVAEELHDVPVITASYWTPPTPWLNMNIINPIVARRLVKTLKSWNHNRTLHLIAHSNGCHVTALALPLLAQDGWKIGTAMFIAAAMPSDLGETPVGRMLLEDRLDKAVALCSKEDKALEIGGMTAYGKFRGDVLGRRGWTVFGSSLGSKPRAITKWYNAFDHSDYFQEKPNDFFSEVRQTFYEEAGLPMNKENL